MEQCKCCRVEAEDLFEKFIDEDTGKVFVVKCLNCETVSVFTEEITLNTNLNDTKES